jgi:hypothetical protein
VNIATQWLTRRAAASEAEWKLKTHAPASSFDYLLREPRLAQHQRRMNITICTVGLIAIAGVLYGCRWWAARSGSLCGFMPGLR